MTTSRTALLVLTSHSTLGASGRATGFYWEEMAAPYWVFRDAGLTVRLASVTGGSPPPDPGSLDADPAKRDAAVTRFLDDPAAMAALGASTALAALNAEPTPDILFLVGGHGTMWDFPAHPALAEMIVATADAGGVVSAVCHGPSGLVGVRRRDGTPFVAGRRLTGFSNEEERIVGLHEVVPFLLEDRLVAEGADYANGQRFRPFVITDGRLVTGQNPRSSEATALAAVEAMTKETM
jgi:putative intracellular protease/amidase